jgi:hypothetical protein
MRKGTVLPEITVTIYALSMLPKPQHQGMLNYFWDDQNNIPGLRHVQ